MQVAIILGADPYRTSAIPELEALCTKPNAAVLLLYRLGYELKSRIVTEDIHESGHMPDMYAT